MLCSPPLEREQAGTLACLWQERDTVYEDGVWKGLQMCTLLALGTLLLGCVLQKGQCEHTHAKYTGTLNGVLFVKQTQTWPAGEGWGPTESGHLAIKEKWS